MTDTATHPCLVTEGTGTAGRLHLPVAPRAAARIRFSSTGKASQALTPHDAVQWLAEVLEGGARIGVVGITGPGDPLITPGVTLDTLRLVRRELPDAELCVTSLGIGGMELAAELAAQGVGLVTLLVDAVSPEVAEALYAWIRPGVKTVPLPEAARMLLNEQAAAVTALKNAGITVKVNTTVYAGVNDGHIEDIAEAMAAMGADAMRLMPFESEDEEWASMRPMPELMAEVNKLAAKHIPILEAKLGCGAEDEALQYTDSVSTLAPALPKPTPERPNVAVCSSSGMDIDLHLGQTPQFLIYGPAKDNGLVSLLGTRPAPKAGHGGSRWEEVALTLRDCFALLAENAGEAPKRILGGQGLRVLTTDGGVEGTVDVLYGGGKKGKKGRK